MSSNNNNEDAKKVLIKKFSDCKISERELNGMIISKTMRNEYAKLIMGLPGHHFVVGTVYSTDFQIGMSGTKRKKENSYDTMTREILEELGGSRGITNYVDPVIHSTHVEEMWCHERKIKRSITCCVGEIQPERIRKTSPKPPKKKNGRHDTLNKVFCGIHGTEANVVNAFNNMPVIRGVNSDGILGVWALQVDHAKKILDTYFKGKLADNVRVNVDELSRAVAVS